MKPTQLKAAIRRLELTNTECACRMGVSWRTVQYWLAGSRAIPGPAVEVLRCWKILKKEGLWD